MLLVFTIASTLAFSQPPGLTGVPPTPPPAYPPPVSKDQLIDELVRELERERGKARKGKTYDQCVEDEVKRLRGDTSDLAMRLVDLRCSPRDRQGL